MRAGPSRAASGQERIATRQFSGNQGIKRVFVATLKTGSETEIRRGEVWTGTVSGFSLPGRSRPSSVSTQRPLPAGRRLAASTASGHLEGTGASASQRFALCSVGKHTLPEAPLRHDTAVLSAPAGSLARHQSSRSSSPARCTRGGRHRPQPGGPLAGPPAESSACAPSRPLLTR